MSAPRTSAPRPRGRSTKAVETLRERAQASLDKGRVAGLGDSLRERVSRLANGPVADLACLPVADIRALLQDLEVHQVELELQNEELRRTQLLLAESRNRLSDLYDFAPVAYLTLDGAAVIRQCNFAAAELLGLPRQKLVGKRFAAFVAPHAADAFHVYFHHTALVSAQKTASELAMHRADHKPLRVRMESTAIGADASHSGHCHAVLVDITQAAMDRASLQEMNRGLEQAVAERTASLSDSLARLRSNEERLALALDAGSMGTWTVDLARGHAYCDERHENLFGRPPNPAGHSLDEWRAALHPEDRERMVAAMQRTALGADPVLAAEYRIVWPDGSAHWLAIRGRVLFDKNGKPAHVVGVEQDIDERKSLEMEVLHIADREQRRIGQELHDDIQQRLTGLGLMAENLCEALSPKPGKKSAPEHAMCGRLTQEIGEASARVNRLSHGLVPLELEGDGLTVALHRLARTTHSPGRLNCVFKSLETLEIRDGLAATHLYRIAQEAVANAIRHSGASRITIALSRKADQGLLTVADNGSGIQPGNSDGRGLRIMAYRASLIGATLQVAKAKSKGTQVSCAFTIARGGADDSASG